MRHPGRSALVPALLLLAGCGLGTRGETLSVSGDRIEINGTPNEATGAKVEAARIPTPAGDFVVWTYPSRVGPCYDLEYPDGERTAGCLETSGIKPHQPVAGRGGPGTSYAINPAAFNYGMTTDADIGMVLHGAAHPAVEEVRIMPLDGSTEPLLFTPFDAPNVEDLRIFVAWVPKAVTDYRLEALDAQGCVLSSQRTMISADRSEQPEQLTGQPGC